MLGATAAGEEQMKHALTYDKTSYENPTQPSKTVHNPKNGEEGRST